ncbi:Uncharacterised protein [Bordetella pertussis]|nr:Uncharacterised protein [Bordetella pertussis]
MALASSPSRPNAAFMRRLKRASLAVRGVAILHMFSLPGWACRVIRAMSCTRAPRSRSIRPHSITAWVP